MAMNDTNHADGRGVDLEVDTVRESLQEYATQTTANDRMALRRLFDEPHRLIHGLREARRSQGPRAIVYPMSGPAADSDIRLIVANQAGAPSS